MLKVALSLSISLIALLLSTQSVNAKLLDDKHYQHIIDIPQRPSADLVRDEGRLPAKLLEFMQIKPAMTVFEQGSAGGYTTELLARAVGRSGKVYAEGLNLSRLKGNRLPQVKPLDRGLIYQIPDRANKVGLKSGQADAVIMMFTYHDLTLNSRIDRAQMLIDMRNLLKKEGFLIIADNAAIEGSGLTYTPKLHRIDQQLVIKEFQAAGFVLEAKSDIYSNPQDDLKAHWRFLSKPRDHHRMLLRFKKP